MQWQRQWIWHLSGVGGEDNRAEVDDIVGVWEVAPIGWSRHSCGVRGSLS